MLYFCVNGKTNSVPRSPVAPSWSSFVVPPFLVAFARPIWPRIGRCHSMVYTLWWTKIAMEHHHTSPYTIWSTVEITYKWSIFSKAMSTYRGYLNKKYVIVSFMADSKCCWWDLYSIWGYAISPDQGPDGSVSPSRGCWTLKMFHVCSITCLW